MISQISKSAAFVFLLIMPAYAYAEDEATAKAQQGWVSEALPLVFDRY
jgi:hypothetical protein